MSSLVDGLGDDRVSKQREGCSAYENLIHPRCSFKPLRESDGRASDETVAGRIATCQDLAGVDPDAQLDPPAALVLELLGQRTYPGP